MAIDRTNDYLIQRLTADWVSANKRKRPASQERIKDKVIKIAMTLSEFNYEQRDKVLLMLANIQEKAQIKPVSEEGV